MLTPPPPAPADARYANALFTAASKANSLNAVEKDIAQLSELIAKVPTFATYLKNPIVKRSEKVADLAKISKGMDGSTRGFLTVLAENGRLAELAKVIKTFGLLMDAKRGTVQATVTSASALSKAEVDLVKSQINTMFLTKGNTLNLQVKVNPELLGGFQVQVGDKFIDLSAYSQLNKVTQMLLESKN